MADPGHAARVTDRTSSRRCGRSSRPRLPGLSSPTSSASSTSTAAATRRPASTRSAAGPPSASRELGAHGRRSTPNDRPSATRSSATFSGADPAARASCCIGHMDTVFDRGDRGRAAVRGSRAGIATRPGRHRHEERPARRAVRDPRARRGRGDVARGCAEPLAAPACFVANPDEEIGSPASTPHIRAARRATSDACLVLECARANGDIVSSRKGTIDLRHHGHTAGPPTPASSPRRGAARSSRRPGS